MFDTTRRLVESVAYKHAFHAVNCILVLRGTITLEYGFFKWGLVVAFGAPLSGCKISCDSVFVVKLAVWVNLPCSYL